MRTPAEYVDAVLPPELPAGQTILLRRAAEAAVAAALADAHRYHALLARAVRNAKTIPSPVTPESGTPTNA